jgi:hypothetical protein
MSQITRPVPEIDNAVERLLNAGDHVHLLNTTIVPPGADGLWRVVEVDISYIMHILSWLGHSGAWGFLHSHIGHESTAAIASELLREKVDVDRRPWDGAGIGVAIQLNGRPPEGKILSREEVEAIGYTLRLVFREPAFPGLSEDSLEEGFPTWEDAIKGLLDVLEPFLTLHSRGAQGEHDLLYAAGERFKRRLYRSRTATFC